MVEENKAPTLDQLKAEMRQAIEDGNDADVARLAKALQKHSADIVKAEAAKVTAEGVALAGDREKLAISIHKGVISMPGVMEALAQVKAKGFTFKLDEDDVKYKAVSLTVPTIRKAGGGGGGGTGVTVQSQTGLRRGELIDQYATDGEKATIQSAFDNAKSSPGSAKWGAEKPGVKRILADNPALIKK